ncbi:MAG: GTPase Era [Bacilli bacterium]|jgi:GTP-binding protein era
MPNKEFKSGFVSIIGRPNVGKSTLLNQILKQKVVIVSPKAQTTRNKIQGIYTTDEEQIIFIDTPGIHKAKNELGIAMNEFAFTSLSGADLILYLVDATVPIGSGDKFIIETLKKIKTPIFLVANKVDLLNDTNRILENITSYKIEGNFTSGITISAANNFNIDKLLDMIKERLPIGPMYYPKDQLLDQPERFVVLEMIREKVLLNTKDEVPHSVAITIERFKELNNLIEIMATIIVERDSQKKIIIGKDGSMIKKIGTQARLDIIKLLGCKVHLELFVKVEKDWRNKRYQLKEFGYINDER